MKIAIGGMYGIVLPTLLLLIVGCVSKEKVHPPLKKPVITEKKLKEPAAPVPRLKLHIERHDNPWSGLTDSAEAEQATLVVPAVKLIRSDDNTIRLFDDLVTSPDYILYRAPGEKRVSVNPKYFSFLNRVDVTGGLAPEGVYVGEVTRQGLQQFSLRNIALILLRGQILRSYWHLEAELELVAELQKESEYQAHFTGRHRYCTNRCQWQPMAFVISINSKNQTLRVLPRNDG